MCFFCQAGVFAVVGFPQRHGVKVERWAYTVPQLQMQTDNHSFFLGGRRFGFGKFGFLVAFGAGEEVTHHGLHSASDLICGKPEVFVSRVQEGRDVCNLASVADICRCESPFQ